MEQTISLDTIKLANKMLADAFKAIDQRVTNGGKK